MNNFWFFIRTFKKKYPFYNHGILIIDDRKTPMELYPETSISFLKVSEELFNYACKLPFTEMVKTPWENGHHLKTLNLNEEHVKILIENFSEELL